VRRSTELFTPPPAWPRRSRRSGLIVLSLLALAALSTNADAARPRYNDVPVAELVEAPSLGEAPKSIAAGETVEGLSLESGHFARLTSMSASDRRCLTARGLGAEASMQSNVFLRYPTVVAVRSERVISRERSERRGEAEGRAADQTADGARASLEIVDLWVDNGNHSMRVARKSTLPLFRLGEGPDGAGVTVWGFRAADGLHVVVSTSGRQTRFRGAGSEGIEFTECGHAHVIVPEAGGSAQVSTTVELGARKDVRGNVDVNVSASRLSRDPAPVLSVAVRWVPEEPPPERPTR
jgi:hypothetical protein